MTGSHERAERAVKNFNRLVPTLESFTEALTGKRMPVKIGSSTMTDGETVYIMPPISLGDEVVHERKLCDYRDESGTPECPACAQREGVLINVYHEVSHVAYDSFAEFSFEDFIHRVESSGLFTPEQVAEIEGRIERLGTRRRRNPQVVAGAVSPFLPPIVGALEDVRVDTMMSEARVGTTVMREAQRASIARDGFERLDGRTLNWSEADLNSQLTVAMIYAAFGDETVPDFDPYVTEAVNLPAMQELLHRAKGASSIREATDLAVGAFMLGQALGFYIDEDEDYNYDQEEEDEVREEGEGQSEGGEGEGNNDQDSGVQPESSGENQPGDGSPEREEGAGGGDNSEASGGDDGGSSPGERGDDLASEGSGQGDSSEHNDGERSSEDSDAGTGGDAAGNVGGDQDSSDQADELQGGASETASTAGAGGAGDMGGELPTISDDHGGDRVLGGDVDSGARRDGAPERPDPQEFGDYRDLGEALAGMLGHEVGRHSDENSKAEDDQILQAETRVEHLDERSNFIDRVDVRSNPRHFPSPSRGNSITVPESILGPSLLKMRRALADNQRRGTERNKRSGRVNSRVLGRRAWSNDDRLFTKRHAPGKRDYAVLIGIDVSGSTVNPTSDHKMNLCQLQIHAAYAQAELCQRLGIKFAVYAHTGMDMASVDLTIFEIKRFDEPWTNKGKRKLAALDPVSMNLDGHTLEYYRKRMDEVRATDKIIMYYSDGAMPAENYHEELRILKREIATCKRKGYILMAVGADSDEPADHGMDTVRIDRIEDVPKVVEHLGKRVASGA